MEKNDILSKILELCEKNMDEGEYLKSAELLKKVNEFNYDKNGEQTISFHIPISIYLNYVDDNTNIVKIVGAEIKKNDYGPISILKYLVVCPIYGDDSLYTWKNEIFEECLKEQLLAHMSRDILIVNMYSTFKFTMEEYSVYRKDLIKACWGDGDHDPEEEEYFYKKYYEYIIDFVKLSIKNYIRTNPFI